MVRSFTFVFSAWFGLVVLQTSVRSQGPLPGQPPVTRRNDGVSGSAHPSAAEKAPEKMLVIRGLESALHLLRSRGDVSTQLDRNEYSMRIWRNEKKKQWVYWFRWLPAKADDESIVFVSDDGKIKGG